MCVEFSLKRVTKKIGTNMKEVRKDLTKFSGASSVIQKCCSKVLALLAQCLVQQIISTAGALVVVTV